MDSISGRKEGGPKVSSSSNILYSIQIYSCGTIEMIHVEHLIKLCALMLNKNGSESS